MNYFGTYVNVVKQVMKIKLMLRSNRKRLKQATMPRRARSGSWSFIRVHSHRVEDIPMGRQKRTMNYMPNQCPAMISLCTMYIRTMTLRS